MAVQTQWRATGFAIIGLDYGVVRGLAGDFGIDLSPGMWAKIKALELATLENLNKAPK